ncbi:MAG: hypothetical protein ACREJC_07945 [Tepidisphaeraceae bacterium]
MSGLHVRVCVQLDGSVKYAVWDFGREEYYPADPEWIGACFAGEPGADPVSGVEVAGPAFESRPARAL